MAESTNTVVAEYEIEIGYDETKEISFTPEEDGDYYFLISGENERFLRTKLRRLYDDGLDEYVNETAGCLTNFYISSYLSSSDNYKIVLSTLIVDNYNDYEYNWNDGDIETYTLKILKLELTEITTGTNTIELGYDDIAQFTFTPQEDGEYTFLLKGENERYLSYNFGDGSTYDRTSSFFCDNVQMTAGETYTYTLSSLLADYNDYPWISENYEYNWNEGDVETYTLEISKADIRNPIEVSVGEYEMEIGYNSKMEFSFTPEEDGTYVYVAEFEDAKFSEWQVDSCISSDITACHNVTDRLSQGSTYNIALSTLMTDYTYYAKYYGNSDNYDWIEGEIQTFTLTIYKIPTIGLGDHEITLGYDSKAEYEFVPEKTGDYYFIIEKGGNNNYLNYMIGSSGSFGSYSDDYVTERSWVEGYSYDISLSTLFDDYYDGYEYGWSEDETYTYTLSICMIEEVETAFSELEDYSIEIAPNTMKKIRFTPEETGEYQISCGDNAEMWLTTVDENPDYNYTVSVDSGFFYQLTAGSTYELLVKAAEASEESIITSICITEYDGTLSAPVVGDVTRDGNVNLYDAIEVAKYMMGIVILDDVQLNVADMDNNGIVNLYDCIEIAIRVMSPDYE